MAGKTIGLSLNNGFVGSLSRNFNDVVMPRAFNENSDPIPFGGAVKINGDGSVSLMDAGSKASDFAGAAVRRVKSAYEYPQTNLGRYDKGDVVDVLERGYMTVECKSGNPTVNGPVFVRVDNPGSGQTIGGFEAVASGTDTVQLNNCKWVTTMDGNKIAEIAILTQQGV